MRLPRVRHRVLQQRRRHAIAILIRIRASNLNLPWRSVLVQRARRDDVLRADMFVSQASWWKRGHGVADVHDAEVVAPVGGLGVDVVDVFFVTDTG